MFGLPRRRSQCVAVVVLLVLAGPAARADEEEPGLIERIPAATFLKGIEKVSKDSETAPIADLTGRRALRGEKSKNAARVEAFIAENKTLLGLGAGSVQLGTPISKETLLGEYVEYAQVYQGVPIIGTHVALTIDAEGRIESLVSSVVSIPEGKAAQISAIPKLTSGEALSTAWAYLAPTGALLEAPTTKLAYYAEPNALTLVFVVEIAVAEPLGYWSLLVDAGSGRVADVKDRRVHEASKRGLAPTEISKTSGTPLDLAKAISTFSPPLTVVGKAVKGKGNVFYPDPLTSLKDPTLLDTASAERFVPAYVTKEISEVTFASGSYHLSGSTIQLSDFEPGENDRRLPPATASKGEWTASRGNNAFNDVMTYHYLLESARYIRSLGLARELFPRPVLVDSDGLGGADNSHYVPSSDRLAFGHGCVDDNEDADVILHELGHAITYHLNPSWSGGDSGAIGEGFGDYWAASFSLATPNGSAVDPAKVFSWDGIPTCWSGRRLDRSSALYDENRSYEAHEELDGFVSDELWATPLFQSLVELLSLKQTRESVDRIILESMDVSASGFTMRSMAERIVVTAQRLSPGGPHADVFAKRFRAAGIMK